MKFVVKFRSGDSLVTLYNLHVVFIKDNQDDYFYHLQLHGR